MRTFLLFLLLLAPTWVSANTYYIGVTGCSDSYTTTQAQNASTPWCTFSHSISQLIAGDTLTALNGTYRQALNIDKSGSSGFPITIQAQNKWRAAISPTSAQTSKNLGIVIILGGTYVKLLNFDILGPSDGTAQQGVKSFFGSSANDLIKGNKIHRVGLVGCSGGAAILSAGHNNTIDSNLIYDIGASPSYGCNDWDGIYLNSGNGQTVINNIIIGSPTEPHLGMLQANGAESNFPSNVTFSNNTVVNGPKNDGLYMTCWTMGSVCDNNKVNNNIFYGIATATGAGVIYTTQNLGTFGRHNLLSNNIIYGSGGNHIEGHTMPVHTIGGNPLFVNYTGDQTGNYHVRSTSPAIKAGTSAGAPNHDFDGTPRPTAAGYVIGAYQ